MPSLRSRIIQTIIHDLKNALLEEIPIETRRLRFNEAAQKGIRLPKDVTSRCDSIGNINAEWILPEHTKTHRIILYLHGGGYTVGSIKTHRGLAGRIAKSANATLILIDYRLAPEYPFPAALHDALSVYHWLLAQDIDSKSIAVGGDSAGGGLTLATSLCLRDNGDPLPASLFMLSPWTDLTFSGASVRNRAMRDPVLSIHGDWQENSYAGAYPLNHPLISPLFADLKGLPSFLVQVGSEEILYDDSTRLVEKALKSHVEATLEIWEGMWHVFQGFAPYVPEADLAIKQIGTYLQEHMPE